MKFTKPWKVIVPGDRYARDFFAGDVVPKDLEKEAVKAGVAVEPAKPVKPAE